ncbi:hypothetical protein GCM10027605_40760 [Micromonospora zhanjiangensis]
MPDAPDQTRGDAGTRAERRTSDIVLTSFRLDGVPENLPAPGNRPQPAVRHRRRAPGDAGQRRTPATRANAAHRDAGLPLRRA